MLVALCPADSSDLRDPEMARASQEKALQALQEYTVAHFPDMPSKFGELLLRIPDLQRTCQVSVVRFRVTNYDLVYICIVRTYTT